MSPGTSTHNATIHAAYLSCNSFEEFADASSGWELDWRQLDRGPFEAQVMQVETPSTLASQFRCNRKFHQRGVSPPGMRTFGIVGARSSPVEWKGREWPSLAMIALALLALDTALTSLVFRRIV